MFARKFSGLEVVGLLAICFVAVATFVHAVSVPNTFVAGDPARASEVNANFAALENAVTNLEEVTASVSTVAIAKDATGAVVGPFTGEWAIHIDENGYTWRISPSGLPFDNAIAVGPFEFDIYYASNNCTGTGYVSEFVNVPFLISGESTWRVVDSTDTTSTISANSSFLASGTCFGFPVDLSIQGVALSETVPDEAISPPSAFTPPLRVELLAQ